jgi:hypothetical protein
MNAKISEDTLRKTRNCGNDFSCLNDEKECLCEAVGSSGDDVLFINPNSNRDCIYCTPFSNSFLCHCPTRNEIYNRYKI